MADRTRAKYSLVEAGVLPEVFIKVTEARELLETGEVRTVAEAVERVGISRSAFYKYQDSVIPFSDMRHGVLSSLLASFAEAGANILTINQSIPNNGTAPVTISAVTENMTEGMDEFMERVRSLYGVIRFDALAG